MSDDQMSGSDHLEILVQYWLTKSEESLASAISELEAKRLFTCVRTSYYACFYALSAVLWNDGKAFKKHSAVRAALHRDYIKRGQIDPKWGRFYDIIFDSRQRGDYQPLTHFEYDQVQHLVDITQDFVQEIKRLIEFGTLDATP